MINYLSEKHSKIFLQKLLDAVDAPKDFDFSQDQYYLKYSWTEKEEQEFLTWLSKFLEKHKYVTKDTRNGESVGMRQAKKLVVNYGWRYKDE